MIEQDAKLNPSAAKDEVVGVLGAPKNSFKLGVEYQTWAGKGYFDRVPLIRCEIGFCTKILLSSDKIRQ